MYNDMNLIFLVFISWFHVPVYAAKAFLEPKEVHTQADASYVLIIKHDTAVPTECYAQNGTQKKYSIDLFRSGISPSPVPNMDYAIQPRASDSNIITSLGNGICGIKVDSVSPSAMYRWNLSFVDQSRNTHFAVARVFVIPTYPRHVVQYEQLGNNLLVLCPSENDNVHDIVNCQLFNPQNQLVKYEDQLCRHTVKWSTVSDFGVWKCVLTYESHMLPTEITFEFIIKEVDIIKTWTNVTDNKVNVGCSVTNATQEPNICVMVRPDGKQIMLKPGLATKRYTALNTNLENSVCVLQIVQPLEESEKGLWQCKQHNKWKKSIGGFVNVSAESSKYKPEPKLPTGVFAHINTTLEFKCQVPFSSPYCYMRGPDGSIYPLKNYRQTSLGVCNLIKEKAQLTDNGTWMCGYGMQTGEPDVVYTFQVHIPEPVLIQPVAQEIESRTAGVSRLICSTEGLGDYPLMYCRFLSPDGHMYQIENHQSSDRISYAGRGLEYGDCGIILQDVSESDQGTWSCITRINLGINEKSEEIYTNIHLTINDSLSVASTVGISFGVAAIVIISTVFLLHRYQKRRNYQTTFNNSAAGGRVSQDSSDSSQSQDAIFNVLQDNVPVRSYNATDVAVRYSSGNVNNPFGSGSDSDHNTVVLDIIDNTSQQRR